MRIRGEEDPLVQGPEGGHGVISSTILVAICCKLCTGKRPHDQQALYGRGSP